MKPMRTKAEVIDDLMNQNFVPSREIYSDSNIGSIGIEVKNFLNFEPVTKFYVTTAKGFRLEQRFNTFNEACDALGLN